MTPIIPIRSNWEFFVSYTNPTITKLIKEYLSGDGIFLMAQSDTKNLIYVLVANLKRKTFVLFDSKAFL